MNLWSKEELRFAVDVYAYMRQLRHRDELYDHEAIRTAAIAGPLAGRSPRSFDMRMGNISYVLREHGEDWLPEYPPLEHVGKNVEREILDVLTNPVREGTLREVITPTPSRARQEGTDPGRDTLEAIARRSLQGFMSANGRKPQFSEKGVSALIARHGLDGEEPRTLEDAGQVAGMSRQRVLQLERKLDDRLSRGARTSVEAPDPLRKGIEIALEVPADTVPSALQDSGLCSGHWDLKRLIRLAQLFGLDEATDLARAADRVATDQQSRSKAIERVEVAVKVVSGASGFAFLSAIQQQLLVDGWETRDRKMLEDLLAGCASIVRLPGDVYYRSRARAPVGASQRMLAISQPLSVQDLRAGLKRQFKARGESLQVPSESLRGFYEWHPDFRVESDGRVSSGTELAELGDTIQMWIVRTIQASDYGLLTRGQIIARATHAKMNSSSVNQYLSYGELISHDRRGFYFPIGKRPSEEAVVEGLEVARLTAVATEQTWRYDPQRGVLELDCVLGHPVIASGVLFIKRESRAELILMGDGKYTILDASGARHGNVAYSDAIDGLVGLQTLLAHTYAEPGDTLTLRIDLRSKTAIADVE